ncbi:AAA family ATPase [Sphingomonas solaris]|uniref:AAA family ATPase n=1 Tax=Alterirhizorhabdus solaris TaxID=2529389 RepID=A0A558R5S2_9SPHN|nr:AAA family ATPase [Sphingomonas solaris]TVV74735.1 AAA family ATPase [Sphingomonas solaris]
MTGTKIPTWPEVALGGGYLARDAATAPAGMDYAIDGLLPVTGTSVWFGQGSAGKTQLLLWMAAHLAAPASAGADTWLGKPIRKRGQILILSAEDLREHLFVRLASIVRGMAAGGKAAPEVATAHAAMV